MEDKKNIYGILVNRSKEKNGLGRPKRGWEGNIKVDIKRACWAVVKRMNLTHNRGRAVKT